MNKSRITLEFDNDGEATIIVDAMEQCRFALSGLTLDELEQLQNDIARVIAQIVE